MKSYEHNDNVIRYNLSLSKGFNEIEETGFNTPANFSEINDKPIIINSGDWYLGVERVTIPSSSIPLYIFPIQLGSLQNDINLSYNVFTFKYYVGNLLIVLPLNACQLYCEYESEEFNLLPAGTTKYRSYPKSPQNNGGQQDLSNFYYYVYYVKTLVKIFNHTLATLWVTFTNAVNALYPNALPTNVQPIFEYDEISQLWAISAPSLYFDPKLPTRVELYMDALTALNTLVPVYANGDYLSPTNAFGNKDLNLSYFHNYYNNTFTRVINSVTYTFYRMSAEQSSVNSYCGFQKIVIELSGDIIVLHPEIESVTLPFQDSTTTIYQKPMVPMATDYEVDRDQWAKNKNYFQYQASSIEQVRLINLGNISSLQNFQVKIYWVDGYGNRNSVLIPNIGVPLTMKIAFYNKNFRT